MKSLKNFLLSLLILTQVTVIAKNEEGEPDVFDLEYIVKLTESNNTNLSNIQLLKNYIKKSPQLIILKFSGDFCPPCRQIKPKVEQLARQYKSTVRFIEVNISSFPEIAKAYGVRSIPSFIFFYKDPDVELLRLIGGDQLPMIKSTITEHLKTHKLN